MQPEEIIGAIIFFVSVGILLGAWFMEKHIRWQTRKRERKQANIIGLTIILSGIGLIVLATVFIIKFTVKKIKKRNKKQINQELLVTLEVNSTDSK